MLPDVNAVCFEIASYTKVTCQRQKENEKRATFSLPVHTQVPHQKLEVENGEALFLSGAAVILQLPTC